MAFRAKSGGGGGEGRGHFPSWSRCSRVSEHRCGQRSQRLQGPGGCGREQRGRMWDCSLVLTQQAGLPPCSPLPGAPPSPPPVPGQLLCPLFPSSKTIPVLQTTCSSLGLLNWRSLALASTGLAPPAFHSGWAAHSCLQEAARCRGKGRKPWLRVETAFEFRRPLSSCEILSQSLTSPLCGDLW